MATFEKSIFNNRPPQEVWDFISNPANLPKWGEGTESAEWASEGPHGVGSTIQEVGKMLGRKIEGTTEITAWKPPNEFGRKADNGPIPWEWTLKLEPKENGTHLIGRGQAEVGGLLKFVEGLIIKQFEKQTETGFEALKQVLEAG
jgi:carbon monoxide dehydrogenase subunit G